MLVCFEEALAVKPVLNGPKQAVEGDGVPGFKQPIRSRQRVVEDLIAIKVAHGNVVDLELRHFG